VIDPFCGPFSCRTLLSTPLGFPPLFFVNGSFHSVSASHPSSRCSSRLLLFLLSSPICGGSRHPSGHPFAVLPLRSIVYGFGFLSSYVHPVSERQSSLPTGGYPRFGGGNTLLTGPPSVFCCCPTPLSSQPPCCCLVLIFPFPPPVADDPPNLSRLELGQETMSCPPLIEGFFHPPTSLTLIGERL